jgi:PAS domain S-box-containing protein
VHTIPDIIYRVDPEGKITFLSDAVRELGYTPEELIGTNILDIIHPDDREKAIHKINERRTGERRTKSFEIRLISKESRLTSYEIRFKILETDSRTFLIDSEGLYISDKPVDKTFLGTQGIARDITEKKKTEKEKHELEIQLFQAQKMESIGMLAGGIAHDFNNILTSMMGYAEVLKSKFSGQSTGESKAADAILRGAERAADLTQQLLGFARGGKYNPEPLNINDTITEISTIYKKTFEKNIKINLDLENDINIVETDGNQIGQVLSVIILNAKDAMPDGGILTLKSDNEYIDEDKQCLEINFKPGKYVKITISDTGIGIPENIKDRIFEPFFSTKGKGKGTGLGLATVYGIIKNHHGCINVHSEPGEGTTFTILLPATEKRAVKKPSAVKSIRGTETIFIVEDEEDLREMAKMQLEVLGYKVLIAEDGEEAVNIYRDEFKNIDLVILDMIMPKMNGPEVFKEFKSINPKVKTVITSGYSQDGKAAEILENGGIGFIQKPFKLENLTKIIHDSLANI